MTIEPQSRNTQSAQSFGSAIARGPTSLWTVLLFGALLFVTSMPDAVADMRGDQFITMMDGNTLSGSDSAGSFNLYFLPGGQLTYVGHAGKEVYGAWRLDKDGDICLRLPHGADALNGCFATSVDGTRVTWRAKHRAVDAQLRGSVVETFIKPVSHRI